MEWAIHRIAFDGWFFFFFAQLKSSSSQIPRRWIRFDNHFLIQRNNRKSHHKELVYVRSIDYRNKFHFICPLLVTSIAFFLFPHHFCFVLCTFIFRIDPVIPVLILQLLNWPLAWILAFELCAKRHLIDEIWLRRKIVSLDWWSHIHANECTLCACTRSSGTHQFLVRTRLNAAYTCESISSVAIHDTCGIYDEALLLQRK